MRESISLGRVCGVPILHGGTVGPARRWMKEMNHHDETMPTMEEAEKRHENFQKVQTESWTDEMIIERQKRLDVVGESTATASAKLKLQSQIDVAVAHGKHDDAARFEEKLKEVQRSCATARTALCLTILERALYPQVHSVMNGKKDQGRNGFRKGLTDLNTRNKQKILNGLQLGATPSCSLGLRR